MSNLIMGYFTADQFERLQRAIPNADREAVARVIAAIPLPELRDTPDTIENLVPLITQYKPSISDIMENYLHASRVHQASGDLQIHQRRIARLGEMAARLVEMLEEEPLKVELMWEKVAEGLPPHLENGSKMRITTLCRY